MAVGLSLAYLVLSFILGTASGLRYLKPASENHPLSKTLVLHPHKALNHSGSQLLELKHNLKPDSDPPQPDWNSGLSERERQSRLLTEKLYGRIVKDLEPWKDGITREMVERLYCTDYIRNFRFQIVNGEPFVVGEIPGFLEFNRMTKLLILETITTFQIPDIDVVISTADECPARKRTFNGENKICDREAPLFSFDRGSNQHDLCVPYPDHTFGSGGWPLAKIPGWKDARNIFKQNEREFEDWEKRNPHLFFRGAPTGNRAEIVQDPVISGDNRFDAKLTGWTGETRDEEYVSLPAHCHYKYLMHMPGIGYSARLKYLMMCGSPVIFPYGGLEEFWYHLLENDKNIKLVPWRKGKGEPMGQKIADEYSWLAANPVRAQEIAGNASDLIHTILSPDVGPRYLAELFVEYAKLQKFTPTVHADATPFRLSAMGPDAKFDVNKRTCSYCKVANKIGVTF